MKISKTEIQRRHKMAREVMEQEGVEALVIAGTCRADQRGWTRYFIDYYVPVFEEFTVLLLSGDAVFFARNEGNAQIASETGHVDQALCIPAAEAETAPGKCVAAFLRLKGVSRAALCGGASASFYTSLCACMGGQILDLTRRMELLRMVKSAEELTLAEQAVKLNEDVFYQYLKGVGEGKKERAAVAEAAYFAQLQGGEDQLWLLGSGPVPLPRSLPMAVSGNHMWKKGDLNSVVIEIAGQGGYYGEICHLVSIGEPREEIKDAFAAVCRAQQAAARLLVPGNTAGAAAEEISRSLVESGYWQAPFPGIIGHGQGLDMSEEPVLFSGNRQTLQAGMRLNLHPCVTLRDGVRVTACDCRLVTAEGGRRLSSLPCELITL